MEAGPDRRRGVVLRAVALGLIASLVAACSGAAVGDSPPTTATHRLAPPPPTASGLPPGVATGPAGAAFYVPPSPLPSGRPGEVIWARPAPGTASARSYLVLYHSRSASGRDIAVSGQVWVPTTPYRGPGGGVPVLAYAHATTGLGPQCAPSLGGSQEALMMGGPLLARGFVLTATDYEGLGVAGAPTYLVGASEAHTVLDSIRVARLLAGDARGPALVWGHSQGGGSALFAAELAPTYAPDDRVIGAVAGAPVSELAYLWRTERHTTFFGFLMMMMTGLDAGYPDAGIRSLMTPLGIDAMRRAAGGCPSAVAYLSQVDPGKYVVVDPTSVPRVRAVLDANSPGNVRTDVPMFVYQGDDDLIIPPGATRLMVERMCRAGGMAVQRRVYPGTDHISVIKAATPDVYAFIDARLAGRPAAPTACPRS
ncbi:MAG TPA: lipase family protein [Acidimicrobiales bacterium]|nr:lipase family protein [Acidimicrobiales bacterium]